MRREVGQGDELGAVICLDQLPNKDISLEGVSYEFSHERSKLNGYRTALFAAQSSVPSLATVTLETATSSSGISWCEHVFSARSQSLILPARSQLMISPWLGWITTSVAGDP